MVSNGTYRVEWAGSPTGAWHSFDLLTNLNSINSTSNSVTVQVPTFYRVLWLDPPPPQPDGTWDYQAYDTYGTLAITGRLTMASQPNRISGNWDLKWTGMSTNDPGPQIGSGQLAGNLAGYNLFVDLDPSTADDSVFLRGVLVGSYITDGIWSHETLGGEIRGGRFVATKRPGPAASLLWDRSSAPKQQHR